MNELGRRRKGVLGLRVKPALKFENRLLDKIIRQSRNPDGARHGCQRYDLSLSERAIMFSNRTAAKRIPERK